MVRFTRPYHLFFCIEENALKIGIFERLRKANMSYNTVSQFKLFAFPSGSFNNVPDATIQNALDVGASMIDSALSRHHTLPLNTGSYGSSSRLALIYNAERVIATYNLMIWRGFRPSVENTQDVVLVNQYNSITGEDGRETYLIKNLLDGKILFPSDADSTPATKEMQARVVGKPFRTVTRTDEDGNQYIIF